MDLKDIVDDEFVQPLRGAIVAENMVATQQLLNSLSTEEIKTETKETVHVKAMSYIIELRDGEQFKNEVSLQDIETWITAKGLDGILDPYAVLGTIKSEGTTWDRKGGSQKLQAVVNLENIKRITDIAVKEKIQEIKSIIAK